MSWYDELTETNSFECAQCGGDVPSELLRCPHCGAPVYPLDEDWREAVEFRPQSPLERAARYGIAVLVGWILAAAAAFVANWVVSQLFGSGPLPPAGGWFLYAAAPLAGFVGGYIAGRLSSGRPLALGLPLALLLLPFSVLLDGYWQELTLDTLLTPLRLVQWGLVLFAAPLGVRQYLRSLLVAESLFHPGGRSEEHLYKELLARVRYDAAAAQSLIEYERRRKPQASRAAWIENAIQRWERDNR